MDNFLRIEVTTYLVHANEARRSENKSRNRKKIFIPRIDEGWK